MEKNEVGHKLEKCSYCKKEVKEVMTPICNHKICPKCLPKIILYNQKNVFTNIGQNIELKCLLCPKGSIITLRVEIQMLLSRIGTSDYPKEPNCEDHNAKVNVHCKECKLTMCQICFDEHLKLRIFSKHKMSLKSNHLINICDTHQKELEYQCITCTIPICGFCSVLEHKDHKIEPINPFYKNLKDELVGKVKLPFIDILKLKNEIKYKENETIEFIQKEATILIDNVQNLIEMLTETKENILSNLKDQIDQVKINYDIMNISYTDLIKQIVNLNSEDYLDLHLLSKIPQENKIYNIEIENERNILNDLNEIKEMISIINEGRSLNLITTIKTYSETNKIKFLNGHSNFIKSVFQLDEEIIAFCADGKNIKCVNTQTQNCISTLRGHLNWVTCIIKLNGNKIASGSRDTTIKIWDTRTWNCIITLTDHHGSINSLINLNDFFLASGSSDDTIKIWNTQTWKCVRTLEEHSASVTNLITLSEGRLASASEDKKIKIWKLKFWECLTTLNGHLNSVNCLIQLNDGIMASASDDMTIKIWSLKTWQCIITLNEHSSCVTSLLKLYDGSLASFSVDKTVKIWNLNKYNCIQSLQGTSTFVNTLLEFNDSKFSCELGSVFKKIAIWE